MSKIIGITGWKDVGKTYYASLIIKLLVKRGYQVGSIKHAHHDFDIDKPGTDSFKHREAGSNQVIISSSKRWAKITENKNENEKSLDELIQELQNVDVIVVEGFKKDNHPKIEILSKDLKNRNKETKNVIAIVSDDFKDTITPVYKENDIENLVEFIIKKIL
ncbi:molybdopterin-guanine dinucleotide biosynthesis protein B [Alphaproteobacteria bacterium]|jgi:molybdopterin-guanine dinucleotide biosynthesis protein B|nr:molybdopterin-guanine dinucleotide biosynthesis protein B [Alphaproteobacteria bacterium]MDC1184355.1 molybdopterin-guanine dinucleotide biosynthesis protein B [Alphaproteobacteria bacterium]|tara:strand:- start:1425 stop:1910 length:486 start_codon:yes stop_codon:yes gene_type:complete